MCIPCFEKLYFLVSTTFSYPLPVQKSHKKLSANYLFFCIYLSITFQQTKNRLYTTLYQIQQKLQNLDFIRKNPPCNRSLQILFFSLHELLSMKATSPSNKHLFVDSHTCKRWFEMEANTNVNTFSAIKGRHFVAGAKRATFQWCAKISWLYSRMVWALAGEIGFLVFVISGFLEFFIIFLKFVNWC